MAWNKSRCWHIRGTARKTENCCSLNQHSFIPKTWIISNSTRRENAHHSHQFSFPSSLHFSTMTKIKNAAIPACCRGFYLFVLNKNATKMPKITLKGFASEQSHWGCNVDKWHNDGQSLRGITWLCCKRLLSKHHHLSTLLKLLLATKQSKVKTEENLNLTHCQQKRALAGSLRGKAEFMACSARNVIYIVSPSENSAVCL